MHRTLTTDRVIESTTRKASTPAGIADRCRWRQWLPICIPCCFYSITVTTSNTVGDSIETTTVHCYCPGSQTCSEVYYLYLLFFSKRNAAYGLQIQREILRNLLIVSTICFIFFLIRSVAFGYTYLIEE